MTADDTGEPPLVNADRNGLDPMEVTPLRGDCERLPALDFDMLPAA